MLFICILGGLAAAQTSTLPELRTAAATMTPGNLLRHIRDLSSTYDGRLPGTSGEEKSVAYVISQIKSIGLQPGTPTSGFVQRVPLYGTRSRGSLAITVSGEGIPMSPAEDFVLWSNLPDERIEVRDSDVVFAGYGVVAPEYKWNDYAGVDVKGKTVIVITGDPPVADSGDSTKLDERVFLGNALTVYGRNGTKLATAFNHGAAAVLLVPPAQPFRYVWENNARENMTLRDGNERQQLRAQALVSIDKAATIVTAAGNDFERARAAAAEPGFRAVVLSARVTITVTNQVRRFESQNILAKIEGSDPALKNEYVIYSGHWDHHGRERNRIFHGASDNAAGTAGVLELARAFRSLNPRPNRTMVFLWPTAEEKGTTGRALLRGPPALSSRLYRREYQSRLFQ